MSCCSQRAGTLLNSGRGGLEDRGRPFSAPVPSCWCAARSTFFFNAASSPRTSGLSRLSALSVSGTGGFSA